MANHDESTDETLPELRVMGIDPPTLEKLRQSVNDHEAPCFRVWLNRGLTVWETDALAWGEKYAGASRSGERDDVMYFDWNDAHSDLADSISRTLTGLAADGRERQRQLTFDRDRMRRRPQRGREARRRDSVTDAISGSTAPRNRLSLTLVGVHRATCVSVRATIATNA